MTYIYYSIQVVLILSVLGGVVLNYLNVKEFNDKTKSDFMNYYQVRKYIRETGGMEKEYKNLIRNRNRIFLTLMFIFFVCVGLWVATSVLLR